MRVGFIGTGRMGAPMVRRLVEAGHDVVALGRSAEKRSAVVDLGASPVSEATQAAEAADIVVLCAFTDEQVREICLDGNLLAHMPPESVLVIHTTGSPRTAENIAAHADHHGVAVLDAPVSGGPHDIASGHLTLFVGGDDAALARVRPVLASYADPIIHAGPIGAGQRVKLINNTVFAAHIGVVAEAVNLGRHLGVEESVLLAALAHGSANSRALTSIAAAGSVASFIAAIAAFVTKDVEVIRTTAAELGADLGGLDAIVNAGLGT